MIMIYFKNARTVSPWNKNIDSFMPNAGAYNILKELLSICCSGGKQNWTETCGCPGQANLFTTIFPISSCDVLAPVISWHPGQLPDWLTSWRQSNISTKLYSLLKVYFMYICTKYVPEKILCNFHTTFLFTVRSSSKINTVSFTRNCIILFSLLHTMYFNNFMLLLLNLTIFVCLRLTITYIELDPFPW